MLSISDFSSFLAWSNCRIVNIDRPPFGERSPSHRSFASASIARRSAGLKCLVERETWTSRLLATRRLAEGLSDTGECCLRWRHESRLLVSSSFVHPQASGLREDLQARPCKKICGDGRASQESNLECESEATLSLTSMIVSIVSRPSDLVRALEFATHATTELLRSNWCNG